MLCEPVMSPEPLPSLVSYSGHRPPARRKPTAAANESRHSGRLSSFARYHQRQRRIVGVNVTGFPTFEQATQSDAAGATLAE